MLEPNSIMLVVLLLLAAGGLIYVAIRFPSPALKIAAGGVAVALSAVSGMAMVNDYYGYYQTWSQLTADLSGSYAQFATPAARNRTGATGRGRMATVPLPGPASHISRSGLVYLPPQYFQPRYAHTRFPVLELMHGSPGNPGNWVVQMNLAAIMNELLAKHLIGPMIVVMPAMNAGHHFQECVDAPGARDDTYISRDVPQDIRRRYRASPIAAEWGIAGYSSGGYCAANLALRHRASYGAAAIMDGYFRPTDGPAGRLHLDRQAEAENNPILAAQRLRAGTAPLPAIWLSSGTRASRYSKGAQAFVAALHGVESVTLVRQPGAGHNFYAWRAVVPRMLTWMWGELAAPQLRVRFPIAGPVDNSIVVPALKPPGRPIRPGAASPSSARRSRSRGTTTVGSNR